jgi:anti-sigma B factor antagonist
MVRYEVTDTVISVIGELDIVSAPKLRKVLTEEIEKGHSRIIIDASALTFCDSMGLRLLLEFLGHAFRARGFLKLSGVHGAFKRALEVTRLYDAFPILEGADDSEA